MRLLFFGQKKVYYLEVLTPVVFIILLLFFTCGINASEITPSSSQPEITPPIYPATDSTLLWLVNTDNPLPASYIPNDMVSYQNKIQIHQIAAQAYEKLTAEMQADGIKPVHLHSAYRSYDRQKKLYTWKIHHYKTRGCTPAEAEALAAQIIQPPGASEHQTGLALDVSATLTLTQNFGETEAGKWLAAYAHRFGFIIRYPVSKTHTTQIIYEPWHLRYVGVPHAEIMACRDLSLEEYGDYLAAHSPYTFVCGQHITYLIQHVNTPPNPLPEGTIDISADRYSPNARFIITSYKTGGEGNITPASPLPKLSARH